jgi:hypothetical protein
MGGLVLFEICELVHMSILQAVLLRLTEPVHEVVWWDRSIEPLRCIPRLTID